jgi:hypothetical protein
MTEMEFDRHTPVQTALDNASKFTEQYFPKFRKDIKRKIGISFCRQPFNSDNGNEIIDYISDIFYIKEQLVKIFGKPPLESKTSIYNYNQILGFAVDKYILLTSEQHINIRTLYEKIGVDRSSFNKIFLDSFSHLGNKNAHKFLNKLSKGYPLGLVDEIFWDNVEKVKTTVESSNLIHYAKTALHIGLIFEDKVGDEKNRQIQSDFVSGFTKVSTNTDLKSTLSFCRGVEILSRMRKPIYKQYAEQVIRIYKDGLGDISPWVIINTAHLEKDEYDYSGFELATDVSILLKKYGETAAWAYVFGIAGVIESRKNTESSLQGFLFEKDWDDAHPNWLEEAIKEIKNSDSPAWFKQWKINTKQEYKDREGRIHNRFIPEMTEDMGLINPTTFREIFFNVLTSFGTKEAFLFSQRWKRGISFYSDSVKSDMKYLSEFPKHIQELKAKVNPRVYLRTVSAATRMKKLHNRFFRNFLDGVIKCYAMKGESVTLKRIGYTVGRYVRGSEKYSGDIVNGLEKTNEKIERKKRKRLPEKYRKESRVLKELSEKEQ